MGNLYFKRSNGEEVLVESSISQDKVVPAINKYVKQINPKFKIYYIRSWSNEPRITTYDVGSHTEFFLYKERME